jgi:MSHA biogenesis protein MshK
VYSAARLALCVLLVATAGALARADEPRLRDPMQPYRPGAVASSAGREASAPRFRLTSVLISPTRRVAIVNGAPRQQGERVDGAELTRIEREAVYFEENGKTWVIHLGGAGSGAPKHEGVPVQ